MSLKNLGPHIFMINMRAEVLGSGIYEARLVALARQYSKETEMTTKPRGSKITALAT